MRAVAVQEISRQLETTGYTENTALQTPKSETNLSVADNLESVNRDVPSLEQEPLPLPGVLEVLTPFPGFEPLSKEETTYAYNRFLSDVVPAHTLGCIRLVAWMMYHTTHQKANREQWQLVASVSQVAEHINMAERSAYSAIKEAEEANFIVCVRRPEKSTRHTPALPGIWKLNTTLSITCVETAFYDGDKYRTPLPNHFVLNTVMQEDLTMVRLLCCVARYTIGFAVGNISQRRHLTAEIGSNKLQEEAGIGSKTWLIKAKRSAIEKHFIKCEPGDGGRISYGFLWSRDWDGDRSKLCTTSDPGGEDNLGKNCTTPEGDEDPPQQNMYPKGSKNCTGVAAEYVPSSEQGSRKKCTTINRDTFKQDCSNRQQETGDSEAVSLLMSVGYDRQAAADISESSSLEVIRQQVEQFDYLIHSKNPDKPLGMLRKAIQCNWNELDGYREWKASKERRDQEKTEKRRSLHRSKFCTTWEDYVSRRITEIERKNSNAWSEFSKYEKQLLAARLDDLEGTKGDLMRPTLERSFHCEDARRKRALKFFSDQILDFWDWDRELNPQHIDSGREL